MTDAMRLGAARPATDYSSLGSRIRIRCDDAEIERGLDDLFAACRRPTGGTADIVVEVATCATNSFEIRANGELMCRDIARDDILAWCTWAINNLASARSEQLVLHAAAAERDGRGVILTGPSGSGKSTLVTALVLSGMSYLTDDSLAVDDGAQIRSNPKPIALDLGSCRALSLTIDQRPPTQAGKALVAPRSLGVALDSDDSCTPALIVRPRFRNGSGTAVAPLTPAEAAELLADQAFNFASDGTSALRAVAALGRSCPAMVIEYGDPHDAVAAISRALAAPTTSRLPSPLGLREAPRPSHTDLDVEILDEEALIWHRENRELHRLSPAATAIWIAAQESRDPVNPDPVDIAAALRRDMRASARSSRANLLRDIEACVLELRKSGLLGARAQNT